jgi:uncharacterized protein YdhG (YjbR/CyaY superfamily)
MDKNTPQNVDDYLALLPAHQRSRMQMVRETIARAAPLAEERISYGMPAFAQNGNLVYFAAWKSHIGFYPAGDVSAFREDLAAYKVSKGTIQFVDDEPLPLGLVMRIVKQRVKQNLEKATARTAKAKKQKKAKNEK